MFVFNREVYGDSEMSHPAYGCCINEDNRRTPMINEAFSELNEPVTPIRYNTGSAIRKRNKKNMSEFHETKTELIIPDVPRSRITKSTSHFNRKMANTDDSTCENIQDFVLAKTGESHQEPQVTQSLWTEVRKTRDVGVQCDQSQIERKETCKLERGKDESSVDKNGIDRENISCVEVERPQKSLVAPKQDHFPAISGKLKIASKETEDANELQKSELEMEILVLKNRLEQAEKEKTEIQEKHDEAFLKIVSDNKKMNESLIEIHEHVRREKIDSERTKVEVEMVLQQRQKLIDEVKNLTKGFEMMISERKRMENVIETSISAFDCKIYVKDEEIRILQETIDNDRKQFLEERDEYLTEIQSLKSELVSRDHGEEKNAR